MTRPIGHRGTRQPGFNNAYGKKVAHAQDRGDARDEVVRAVSQEAIARRQETLDILDAHDRGIHRKDLRRYCRGNPRYPHDFWWTGVTLRPGGRLWFLQEVCARCGKHGRVLFPRWRRVTGRDPDLFTPEDWKIEGGRSAW